ncbi:type VII secretion protein EccB [Streptomyces sp. YS415]|uniref:type VII secretion protein EccB n=1 Tax=Streptomyces sp. YS415 TaxID=2944806 RepID=UPI00202013E1|nr:type VII secretion protein EccB [Streptomyces sp. YS415]MCL7429411.1 type VII secretion protein EccB [Streptomyces sp. YS415]
MQTKRDQVQAHMFVMGRLTSSMLRADPDAPESPQGRTNRGTAIGALIAVVICAGAFVFGLIKPGTTDSWRTSGALVVNRDTGSRYLYLDGRLRPVYNYASARLLAGPDLKTTTVGGRSLRGTPLGPPVGVPGAPDTLPSPGDLVSDAWLVCSRPADTPPGTDDGTDGARPRTATVLAVGTGQDGQAPDDGRGLLVRGPDGTAHLVWRGSRLRLDTASRAATSLGYASTAPLDVSAAFLSALPAGPDLKAAPVPGRGGTGPNLGGRPTRIGQLFKVAVPGSTPRLHLLRQDGLVPLTDTAAALLLGDPATRRDAYDGGTALVRRLGPDALDGNLATGAPAAGLGAGLPPSPPRVTGVPANRMPCAQVSPGADGTRVAVTLVARDGLGPAAQPPAEHRAPACLPVDEIVVPPGRGALVRVLGAAGTELGATTYLVTDTGMKYGVPRPEDLAALGHSEAAATALPSLLLSMLPTGPDLGVESAATGQPTTTTPKCSGTRRVEGKAP